MPDPESVFEEPAEEQIPDSVASKEWSCFYEPSLNDDWHDDVLCLNGAESLRPILLPQLGFVTEDQMIAAGAAYEAQLNGR